MNVIKRKFLDKAKKEHPDSQKWIDAWWTIAKIRQWRSLDEVRVDYPSADQVGNCLVFNACGNKYRLIVKVTYANRWASGTLFTKHFLTHAQYDKDLWKTDCCK